MQNGKDSVILITNDVGNKERKDDESMGALVALGVFTAIAIVAVSYTHLTLPTIA